VSALLDVNLLLACGWQTFISKDSPQAAER
jgi:hypothetical protein